MSHFTVLILGDDIEGQLEQYNENTSVEPYKDYETGDPKDFWCVKSLRESGLITVPDSELTWQIVADAYNSRYSDDEGERYFIDDDGDMYRMSTYNPDSKWDWYQVGGRWSGYFDVKPGCEEMVRLGERSWANEGKTIETTKCDQGLDTCLARINEECGEFPHVNIVWRRQPSIEELRTFVEAAARDDADPYWIQGRAREIMGA